MGDCSGTRRRKKKENNSFGWVYLRFAQHGRAPRVSAADSFLLPVRVPKAPRYTLTILAREKNKDRDRGIKQTVCGWDGTGWDGTGKRDDVWRNIQRHVVSRYLRYCAPTPFNFNKNGGEELLKFQATSIWLLVINRIVDQFFPEFFRNGKVKNLSVIKIGKLVSKSINRKGGGTKKRTTPREINPFESLPPPL